VKRFLNSVTDEPYLTRLQLISYSLRLDTIVETMEGISEDRNALLDKMDELGDEDGPRILSLINELEKIYAALVISIQQTERTLIECKKGIIKRVGKQKPGTLVSVVITPRLIIGEKNLEGKVISFEYWVTSSNRLNYSIGLSFSNLDQVEFDKVRALSGQDVYKVIKNEDNTLDLVSFVSYEFSSWGKEDDFGLGILLGTSFREPGESFYLGGNLRLWGKIDLSFGGHFTTNQMEVNSSSTLSIGDTVTSIAHKFEVACFLGISVSLR